MTEPSHAVFLSYASQDTEAAQKICEALHGASIEVFLDQSELRGGDVWDQKIRREIHDCALFIPIISQHTQERLEGYFRHEWNLAIERTHHMAQQKPFLVPVVVDGTRDQEALVPDAFRAVQWTRLPGGDTPPTFVERIKRLLSQELSPLSAASGAAPIGARVPVFWRSKRVLVAVIAVLAALSYLVADKFRISKHFAATQSAPAVAARSVAVLPFANESGDASQQYFSDGLSEDLITALSQFPGLKVIGRNSAFQFRDSKDDSRTIGAKLGVAHLLEGSVRHAGEFVRVSAELVAASDGSTLWSERYDRPYKDLFAVQDDITRAVSGALKARLMPGAGATVNSDRPPSGDLEAYNALLQGRFYEARHTETDIRAGIEQYTLATRLDPRYALAWSSLSIAWATLATSFSDTVPMQPAWAEARTTVATALALAPDLAAAHAGRGKVLQNADLNWRAAAEEFRRALELAPYDGEAKFYLGSALATLGQVENAVELTRQALATDPLRANWYNWLATYLQAVNGLDEAERAVRKAIELQPSAGSYHETLAVIEIQRGEARAALTAAQQEPEPGWQAIALALAYQECQEFRVIRAG